MEATGTAASDLYLPMEDQFTEATMGKEGNEGVPVQGLLWTQLNTTSKVPNLKPWHNKEKWTIREHMLVEAAHKHSQL